jgi:hypothetical protein
LIPFSLHGSENAVTPHFEKWAIRGRNEGAMKDGRLVLCLFEMDALRYFGTEPEWGSLLE